MEAFVTALEAEVTASNLWGGLTPLAGLIGVVVIFAFGYYLVKRVIRGVGSGKAKI